MGKHAEAGEAFKKASTLDPNDPQPQYNQVVLLREKNDPADAETALHAFVAKFPNHAGGQNDLGVIWEKRGDKKKAIDSYVRAIASNAGYVPSRLNLIRLLCEERRFAESTPHMQALARIGMNFLVDKKGNDVQIDINGKPFFRGPAT